MEIFMNNSFKISVATIILFFCLIFADQKQLPPTKITNINQKQTKDKTIFPIKKRYRTVKNKAFAENEFLHFVVNYGLITAGYATISIDRIEEFNGRKCFVLKTTADSRKAFDWIFKVRDWTESYLDKERFHTLKFEKHLREGSYHRDIVIKYNQESNTGKYWSKKKNKSAKEKTFKIPDNVMDPLSALFYVRTMDIAVGDEILIPASDNKKIYNIKVIVHKREKIEIKAGKFDCFVVEPIMADGGVFKKDGKVKVWLTADEFKMPVKMETKVYIGSITAELDWYEKE